ncbi:hypothetical protein FHX82_006986 [Amycolatopsis bartoniae]|uniref:Uncharacterized protein n=1 Tax=Amycolatopsis bartoniae TaxID=941986 RepID=A0A8H9ISF6_9PSEU|nr:hypothetical protein [Amycolatopsis bartoniae]MBB2939900.1 hypothetical protein [Amycolatopsis bartoniae]TVT08314.1 hypothetical protein FNH07_12860 [Amycolatopsis bartoniae]GHF35781.1 hypothetical protein GCM10017566_05950 [Amycolatopsis bartoniae]
MTSETVEQRTPWYPSAYRTLLGWEVEWRDGQPWLRTGNGVVGASVPAYLGPLVVMALSRSDQPSPVLELAHEQRWVFLADANDDVPGCHLPLSTVEVLSCPASIPLPAAGSAGRPSRWVRPPDPRNRWLPTLAAITAIASRFD